MVIYHITLLDYLDNELVNTVHNHVQSITQHCIIMYITHFLIKHDIQKDYFLNRKGSWTHLLVLNRHLAILTTAEYQYNPDQYKN